MATTLTASIKRSIKAGDVFDVTNHFITVKDHPCYGTTRRTVTRVSGTGVTFDDLPLVPWPKAEDIRLEDGAIVFYAYIAPAFGPFLTLRRVTPATVAEQKRAARAKKLHDGIAAKMQAQAKRRAEAKALPQAHTFTVTVQADTHEQATRVMAERFGYDEDYGFDYTVDWSEA